MRKVVTLTGKNLPRLAVAKPGWPWQRRKKKQTADELIKQFRSDYPDLTLEEEVAIRNHVELGHNLFFRCNFNSGTAESIADFTRVCDQTGLSEKLRKD